MNPQLDPQIKAVLDEIVRRTPNVGDSPTSELSYLNSQSSRDGRRWGIVTAATAVTAIAGLVAISLGTRESGDTRIATQPTGDSVSRVPSGPSSEVSSASTTSPAARILFEHLEYTTNADGQVELRFQFDHRIDETEIVRVADARSASTTEISYFVQDGAGTTNICEDEHCGYAPTAHVLLPGEWFDQAAETRGFVFPFLRNAELSADSFAGVGKIVGCRSDSGPVEVTIALLEPVAADALEVTAEDGTLRIVFPGHLADCGSRGSCAFRA